MELSKYEISFLQKDTYWFISTGKKGDIYKGILFQPLPGMNWYNLALGDINLQTLKMEFDELSGNGDARKVFATIGDIVKDYTETYPERLIFVSGNTDEKKRSYSFMTAWYLDDILMDFNVWGLMQVESLNHLKKVKRMMQFW